jgi:hypothetical protein
MVCVERLFLVAIIICLGMVVPVSAQVSSQGGTSAVIRVTAFPSGATASPAAANASAALGITPAPINSSAAQGFVSDVPLVVKHAYYDGNRLLLKSDYAFAEAFNKSETRDTFNGIQLTFPSSQSFAGSSFKTVANQDVIWLGDQKQKKPQLTIYAVGHGFGYFQTIKNTAPYVMNLQFYKEKNGTLPGFIDLYVQDSHKTLLRGYFYAEPLKPVTATDKGKPAAAALATSKKP